MMRKSKVIRVPAIQQLIIEDLARSSDKPYSDLSGFLDSIESSYMSRNPAKYAGLLCQCARRGPKSVSA